jgi:polyhydroxybutyrate depolymerase
MKKILLTFVCFSSIIFSCERLRDRISPITEFRVNGTMTVDGLSRTYLLNLPSNYNEATDIALVIGLHGGAGSASQMEKNYFLTDKANQEKFAIVYAEGVQSDGFLRARTWNAGTCCDYAVEKNIDDVKFISTLIDELLKKYPNLNRKKVYVTGMSNGAMMSYRLACELSNKIAAIAPVAGTALTTQVCQPTRPVPILHIHSLQDTKVPYKGGTGIFGYYFPPVENGLNTWIKLNSCNTTSKSVTDFELYSLTKWTNCNNSSIEYYQTKDGGHSWPRGEKVRSDADEISNAISANDVIWDFFKKYQLP